MKCAVHSEVEATGYCRNCGKPLCAQCSREVRGAYYCEECIAAMMSRPGAAAATSAPASQFAPAAGAAQFAAGATSASPLPPTYYGYPHPGPNPGAALGLGFIPGLGAVYNGEYVKALIHVLIFAGVIGILNSARLSDSATAFAGVFLGLFCCYMPIEAYRTARAKRMGQTPPSFFAGPASASAAAPGQGAQSENLPVERHTPLTGGVILIIIGVLFLLGTMGLLSSMWWDRLWPLILVALGIWLIWRRTQRASS